MWTKVLFLAIVYVGSFISFLLFSISQQRAYQYMDAKQKTMKDFALEVTGLPAIPGSFTTVEKDLQEAIERQASQHLQNDKKLVGVSIAWD